MLFYLQILSKGLLVMEIKDILAICDHTLLLQGATWEEIKGICDDAMKYKTASVCIPPCYVKDAVDYMKGSIPVCTVIGFPNGNTTTKTKLFETEEAIANGAKEIDMVINIGWVKSRDYNKVGDEIDALAKVCHEKGAILKVIIETCLLTEEEKIAMCHVVSASDADFIKTSTGFSTSGATFDDVKLMRTYCSPDQKIKAAGGISSIEDAKKFMELGADRLGTSRIVKIVKSMEQ